MLCGVFAGRGGGCRRRSAETGPTCDCAGFGGNVQLHELKAIHRLAACDSPLAAAHGAVPALQSGAPGVPRPRSPTERRTAAPMVGATLLFIISADATWSRGALVAMRGVRGPRRSEAGDDVQVTGTMQIWRTSCTATRKRSHSDSREAATDPARATQKNVQRSYR